MNKQLRVITALLSCVCVLTYARLYQPQRVTAESATAKSFPEQLGTWQMTASYPPTPREIELLETDNILNRSYRDASGRTAALVLVYDPSGNRKMAHPQEICLAADGNEIIGQTHVDLGVGGINAQRLLTERNGGRLLYYYWYKSGDDQSGSYLMTQTSAAWSALLGKSRGTALIRIATPIGTDHSEEQADKILQDFARALVPELTRVLP